MTNLPLKFREELKEKYIIGAPDIAAQQQSAIDGTMKLLLRYSDGLASECVIMPHEDNSGRCTVCVSSQIGCPIGCAFCATGNMGFCVIFPYRKFCLRYIWPIKSARKNRKAGM